MIEVLKTGLETCVQDYPGRKGVFGMGFPPSGPIDHWSFRLANLLVGNKPGDAALECQFIGPALKFKVPTIFALTGGDMQAKLDGARVPLWQSVAAKAGQKLELDSAIAGARCYIAFAGGINTPPFLGSRSSFVLGQCGGLDGAPLAVGGEIPVGAGKGVSGRRIKQKCLPPFSDTGQWQIEVCAGPNDDWIDDAGQKGFLESLWKLSPKSNRVGFRLEGPRWTFAEKATDKAPENGSDPSNIIDHGYPIGAINLGGQTPIILLNDTLTLGGFINPYTVPSCAFWKLGQSRPNEIYEFELVSIEEAQARKRAINAACSEDSIEPA